MQVKLGLTAVIHGRLRISSCDFGSQLVPRAKPPALERCQYQTHRSHLCRWLQFHSADMPPRIDEAAGTCGLLLLLLLQLQLVVQALHWRAPGCKGYLDSSTATSQYSIPKLWGDVLAQEQFCVPQ